MNEVIELLHNKLNRQKIELQKYHEYYIGNHDIYKTYNFNDRSNIIEVHNFCKEFIDNNVGFLLGNNIKLKYQLETDIEDENIVDYYNQSFGSIIQQHNQRLMQTQQIFGYTYEINYINTDGEFSMTIATPLEMSIIRDGNKVQHALLEISAAEDIVKYNYFNILDKKIHVINVDTSEDEISITEDVESAVDNIINNPVIVVYNNWETTSEMKGTIPLNDAYNQISSDLTNEISDHRNAYLSITGATIDDETLLDMKKKGLITSKADAKVQFITKEINDVFVQNKLDQLKEQMYNLAAQVDFNDTNIGSNTSSLALRNKLSKTINKLDLTVGFIKEAHNIRLKNFSQFLDTEKSLSEELNNHTLVDIQIIPNIPTSNKEVAEMVIDLNKHGLLSRESAISELSMVSDARAEILKIDAEIADEYDDKLNDIMLSIASDNDVK